RIYTSLITAHGRAGKLEELDRFFMQMKHVEGLVVDVAAYNAMMRSYSNSLQWQSALRMFDRLKLRFAERVSMAWRRRLASRVIPGRGGIFHAAAQVVGDGKAGSTLV
ncbi:hypothetical protein CYMTET_30374, partial [Cymbomonas tetramitiformis]